MFIGSDIFHMISIKKEIWFPNLFGRVTLFSNILRQPVYLHHFAEKSVQDSYRQTQVFTEELIRILGHHDHFSLVMKYDGTLGWIEKGAYEICSDQSWIEIKPKARISPEQFFSSWQNTIYLWGGLSKEGIDCSGLSQLFFFDVHGIILPKNSKDQRKLGKEKHFTEIKDSDLVFCRRKDGTGTHHVAIFFNHGLWHARLTGVAYQTIEDFLNVYDIESIVEILK